MSNDTTTPDAAGIKAQLDFAVTPSALLVSLEHLLSSRRADGAPKEQASVMIWGAMGIGKTDIARSVGKLWGARIVALHLPQFDPTDIKGIPVKLDDDKVVWVPSSYLPKFLTYLVADDNLSSKRFDVDWPNAEQVMVHITDKKGKTVGRFNDQMNGDLNDGDFDVNIDMVGGSVVINGNLKKGTTIQVIEKAILLLDELSTAVPEVQNAALQLVLDKRVGEYDVPPFTPIVAAGNRESDAAFVSPMSAPLCNRFVHLRLMPALDDWLEWAMLNKVHPHILGYLQWKKSSRLFQFNADTMTEGDCGFPSPRSWAKLSEQLYGIEEVPKAVQNAIISGYVGKAVGHEFIQYRQVCELLPSTDDILQAKEGVTLDQDMDIGAKYGLATALCYAIKEYHDRYYDESRGTDVQKQPKEWRTATVAFCGFIDEFLGKEMTVLCVHIVSRHLGISFTKFRGTSFTGFAHKYRDIMKKTL